MTVDPYSSNPLADEMRLREPQRFETVSAVKEPPKMFAGGTSDVPAFTASGIDPQLLLKLPAGIRHAAAANPDINEVHYWFEEYAHIPEAEIDHDGLGAAKLRMEDWLENTDLDTRTPEQREADLEAGYREYFNPENDRYAYVEEQRRRERAGEQPLDDWDVIQQRRANEQRAAARADHEPQQFPGMSEDDLQRLATLVKGWG